jgi:hypothetical protein
MPKPYTPVTLWYGPGPKMGKPLYCKAQITLMRDLEVSKVPFIVTVMPEWFYQTSSKDPGFPLNSIAGMTALCDSTTGIFRIAKSLSLF